MEVIADVRLGTGTHETTNLDRWRSVLVILCL
jgi:hypothetical protein